MAERSIENLTDALSAPLGDLIASVADGVAQAQSALDRQTLQSFKAIYQSSEGLQLELQRMGYQPTWYKIPEVKAEIVMTLTIGEREVIRDNLGPVPSPANAPVKLFAAPVDANYVNHYGYDIQGASTLKFSIVAVPPSAQAESMQVVPAMDDMPIEEARALLEKLGIGYAIQTGSGTDIEIVSGTDKINARLKDLQNAGTPATKVSGTRPKPGQILKPGEYVKLLID